MKNKLRSTQSHTGFQPEWVSFEVHEALGKIAGEHVHKKEATVLHMAQALATGQPVSAVFVRGDTCSKKVWYGWQDGDEHHPGWKDDPAIARALEVATSRARWWVRVRGGKAIENALDVLVNAGEAVAEQIVRVAIEGRAAIIFDDQIVYRPAEVRDILKAADSVLDRIDKRTAAKTTTEVTGAVRTEQTIVHDLSRLSTDELKALRTIVAKAESDESAGVG